MTNSANPTYAQLLEALRLQEAVDEHVANCEDCCEGAFPELCESGFPLADAARLARRAILYIEQSDELVPRTFLEAALSRSAGPAHDQGFDEATESRWQKAIYEVCKEAVGPEHYSEIDGGGCDSGDALDFTLTEIRQALDFVRENSRSAPDREAPREYLCPKCKQPLQEIRYPSTSPLNRDQWESQLPGDLFCVCHNNYKGNKPYAYFWKSEFVASHSQPSVKEKL